MRSRHISLQYVYFDKKTKYQCNIKEFGLGCKQFKYYISTGYFTYSILYSVGSFVLSLL